MADTKLTAVIQIADKMSKPLKGLNNNLKNMQRPIRGLQNQIRQFDRLTGLKNLRQQLGGIGRMLGRGGLIGGTAVVGGLSVLTKSVIDISAQFEKYEAVLTSIEGNNETAKKSMDWVQDFAAKTPFQLNAVMDSFVSLKTFGLDPMDGSMQAIVDASAKMGGSQEHLKGIILGLGQAWTKGKLQGEEALQLIERGIPVWDLLAKASNKTAVELQEMSSKGQLGRDAISALIKAMGADSIGASAEQMKTWNGLMSNLADQWDRFKLLIGSSGIFDVLRDSMKNLLVTVDKMASNGQLKELAKSISDMMVSAFNSGKAFSKELIPALRNMGAWLAETWPKVKSFVEAIGGMKTVLIAAGLIIAGPLLSAAVGLIGPLTLLATTVATLVTPAIIAMGKAMLMNPIGLAVTAIAAAAYLIYKNWEPIKDFFTGLWDGITETFQKGMEKIQPIIDILTNAAKTLAAPVKKLFEFGSNTANAVTGAAGDAFDATKSFLGFGGDEQQQPRQSILSGSNKVDTGGVMEIRIKSDVPASVEKAKPNNSAMQYNTDVGYSLVGM